MIILYTKDNQTNRQLLINRYVMLFFTQGLEKIIKTPFLALCAGLYILVVTLLAVIIGGSFSGVLSSALSFAYTTTIVIAGVFIGIIATLIIGLPKGFCEIQRNLNRVGGQLNNALGESPVLISRSSKDDKTEIWELESFGTTHSAWTDEREKMQ